MPRAALRAQKSQKSERSDILAAAFIAGEDACEDDHWHRALTAKPRLSTPSTGHRGLVSQGRRRRAQKNEAQQLDAGRRIGSGGATGSELCHVFMRELSSRSVAALLHCATGRMIIAAIRPIATDGFADRLGSCCCPISWTRPPSRALGSLPFGASLCAICDEGCAWPKLCLLCTDLRC
jgi:hypothetical protein